MTVAVITAAFGVDDNPGPPIEQTIATDFYCFGADISGWERRDAPVRWDSVRQARAMKIYPYDSLPKKYGCYIWMDASFSITSRDFTRSILTSLGGRDLGFLEHPSRSTVAEEAKEVMRLKYCDTWDNIPSQVGHYRNQGFDDCALYATGIMARRESCRIRCLMLCWLVEVLSWCTRDQISLPYLLWREGIQPSIIGTIYNSKHWRYNGHPERQR